MEIFCIGDSLTYGYGVTRSKCWPSLLAATGLSVHNLGVNGDTTGGMLARMEAQLLSGALKSGDLAFILGGCNDIFCTGAYLTARSSICAMAQQLSSLQIRPVICTPMGLGPSGYPEAWEELVDFTAAAELIRAYNGWLRKFCPAFGLELIDLEAVFDGFGSRRPELFLDGIHPTAAGHAVIAGVLADFLRGLF